jgi:molybdopterin-dependent oxidoreductase alpha subunit
MPGVRRAPWRGLPNGIGEQKPNHFGEMARTVWENRRSLPYAWRILSRGTCDGCALGTAGLHDWTIDGVHLCTVRLSLLKLNTARALDPSVLADVAALDGLDGAALRELGRLPHPMLRRHGDAGFRRIGWDEAIDTVAGALRATDPSRAALYLTSRGITNEVYYAAQKAWRSIGSPHCDNAARVCHSPSTSALRETVGVAATTCSYTDLFETDLVVFFGSDVANNQPVMMKYLDIAKANGARVVTVNPYREPGMVRYWVPSNPASAVFGTNVTDDFFDVTTGGDIAFLAGVCKQLVAADAVDATWIDAHTDGWEAFRGWLGTLDWDDLERASGLKVRDMARFAEIWAAADRAIVVWSMGITQHRHGADNVRMLVNLALTRGMVGRDGCGLMPIRGHSGVQGGAEMGAYAGVLPGGVPCDTAHAATFSEVWGFDVPTDDAFDAVAMLDAAADGDLDVLISSGGNFLDVLPDPPRVRRALASVPLRVHSDIVVSSQMLVEPPPGGAVVLLPVMTRYEQPGGGTETTTERRIVFSPEIPGPRIGEARAEWQVFGDIAAAVRGDRAGSFDDAQAIRDEIERCVPSYAGIAALRGTGDAVQWGGRHLCVDGRFPTPDGRARFSVVDVPDTTLAPGEFRVSTRRGKQFNSMVQRQTDPLTGARRDAVFMSPADAASLGLADGDRVVLRSATGAFDGRVRIARMAPRNLAVFWPEGNTLISGDVVATDGGVPDYNAIVRVAT